MRRQGIRLRDREATVLPYTLQPATMADRRREDRNRQLLAALLIAVSLLALGPGLYILFCALFGRVR